MIGTVIRIGALRLWHNRLELALAFVVPILFFSIFAVIFGGQLGRGLRAIKVAVVDDDQSAFSGQVVNDLAETSGLRLVRSVADSPANGVMKSKEARRMVKQGQVAVAVIIPSGLADSLTSAGDTVATVELLTDSSEPVAVQLVAGRLRESIMTRQGEFLKEQGARRARAAKLMMGLNRNRRLPDNDDEIDAESSSSPPTSSGWNLSNLNVLGDTQSNPAVTMYAAGIAVLFLLFSTMGAAGTLLEEEEAGTLERLLTTHLSLLQLLAGKWLWTTMLGIAQTTVMFVWAWLVFGIDLPGRILGFAIMTAFTSGAAASLALCLATLCRSRQQLIGVSTILILSMSALGGSMVPRYVMSESLQRAGLFTFNAWALDGYTKVFWRELPISELGPQVAVLFGMTVALLVITGWRARRWRTM